MEEIKRFFLEDKKRHAFFVLFFGREEKESKTASKLG